MATTNVSELRHDLSGDDVDSLLEKSSKLSALLVHTYGESGESFRGLSGDLQDRFMWTCSDLMFEIEALAEKIVLRPI